VVAFLVGLRGSGHQLVEAVVKRIAPQIKNCAYDDRVNYWRDTVAPAGSSFLTYLDENPDVHFFGKWSYPAGPEGRTHASARVSLVKLVCLNATRGPSTCAWCTCAANPWTQCALPCTAS
jgi:hypothetical protein